MKDLKVVIDYLDPESDLRKSMEKIQLILEEEPETPEERDQREEDEHENYLLSDQYDDDCKYEKWDWLKNECG